MKKIILFTSLLPIISTAPALAILSSCSKYKTEDVAHIDKKIYYSDADEQSLFLALNNDDEITDVEVELDQPSTDRLFVKEILFIDQSKRIEIKLALKQTGQNLPETVTFNLNLYFKNNNGKVIYYQKINDFVINFRGYTPKQEDIIFCRKGLTKTVSGVYSTTFVFSCYEEPKSDFNVTLTDTNNVLSLEENVIKPVKDERPGYKIWYINIKININLSQFQTKLLDFKLQFDFINSFGVKQTNIFDKMIIKYNRDYSNILPTEYYDIRDNVLVGIKRDASSQRIFEDCNTIAIPEGVKAINSGVFGPANSLELNSPYLNFSKSVFANIKKIILPSSVDKIEEKAFYYCENINEFDITSYGDMVPTWLTANKQIFDKNNLGGYIAYVWTKNSEWSTSKFINYFDQIGLSTENTKDEVKTKWFVAHQNVVTPANLFKYSEIGLEKHIIGVQDEYIDYLWSYKIIRIPDDVTHIDVGSLKNTFGKKPYFNGGKSTDLYTRRLFLGKNLQCIDPFAFDHVGIAGPLFIPTYSGNLGSIVQPEAFLECFRYNAEQTYTFENFRIVFEQSNNVVNIPDDFFTNDYESVLLLPIITEIVLPKYIGSIGSRAFRHSSYLKNTKITIPEGIEQIGERAFEYFDLTTATGENSEFVIGPYVKNIGKCAFAYNQFHKLTFKCWHEYTHYEWEGEEGDKKLYKIEEIVSPTEIAEYAFSTESSRLTDDSIDTIDLSYFSKDAFMERRKTEVGKEPAEKTYNFVVPQWMSNASNLIRWTHVNNGTIIFNSMFNTTDEKIVQLRNNILEKIKTWGNGYISNWKIEYK